MMCVQVVATCAAGRGPGSVVLGPASLSPAVGERLVVGGWRLVVLAPVGATPCSLLLAGLIRGFHPSSHPMVPVLRQRTWNSDFMDETVLLCLTRHHGSVCPCDGDAGDAQLRGACVVSL
jgi:hypothetical protein